MSDNSFVQVCDGLNVECANSQLNSFCIIHGLEVGGMGGKGVLVSHCLSFSTKISHPALFHRVPESFFFSKIHELKKSDCCKSVRCRLTLSIYVLNYTLV